MGYKEAPWVFKGRAIYQLQLVKSEEARKYIPENFKLVELFGYTLGGFYLARYDDSPAGSFDELVALAGLVWNAPTSCAWAGRVYVNNRDARDHGIKHVGLPSRLAHFSTSRPHDDSSTDVSKSSWWHWTRSNQPGDLQLAIKNVDSSRCKGLRTPVVTMHLPQMAVGGMLGPRITLPLPSFSGATREHPGLLEYACQLHTNVLPIAPLTLDVPYTRANGRTRGSPEQDEGKQEGSWWRRGHQARHEEDISYILGGKPLVALAFNDMVMTVNEPEQLILQVPSVLNN